MRFFNEHGHWYRYASKRQLLRFARKVRAAGAGDFLTTLHPAERHLSRFCLIAQALNFSCVIGPVGCQQAYGDWSMWFSGVDKATARRIAKAVGGPLETGGFFEGYKVVLPRKIGYTAWAFDLGKGWTKKYALDNPRDA